MDPSLLEVDPGKLHIWIQSWALAVAPGKGCWSRPPPRVPYQEGRSQRPEGVRPGSGHEAVLSRRGAAVR